MSDVLAFVEQRDGAPRGAGREVISQAARVAAELGGKARALLLGTPGLSGGSGDLGRWGAASVRVAEHEALESYVPEAWARVVAEAVRAGDYAAVLFPATSQGRDLAPRVAARLDVPAAADITGMTVEGGTIRLRRPVYAGKAFATVTIDASPVVASLRPNVFPPEEIGGDGTVEAFTPDLDPSGWRSRIREFRAAGGGDLDVSEASVVVAGGRGMKEPDHWPLLEELRDAIGGDVAALGASRAVVDAGWRPHGEQVGQTGKTVSPKLYFAVGISGAIQHLAGMRTSGTIVAVNKDADAPIFNVADYGIVGDLFEVVPRLSDEIRKLKSE